MAAGLVTGRPDVATVYITESLILAQNERWQRGLGMQVEREFAPSSRKVRRCEGEWRKGEEHVGNLSPS